MMNGELQSEEALILKREIHSIGTTVLRAVQDMKTTVEEGFAEQAESNGKVIGELGDIRRDVRDIKRVVGIDGGATIAQQAQPHHHAHRRPQPNGGEPPSSGHARPSLPPQFEDESDSIVVTDTGSYRIPPGTLERISRKFAEMEQEKLVAKSQAEGADLLKKQLEANNKRLTDRVTFVIAVAGGVVAFISAVFGFVTWSIHHVR